MQLKKPIGVVDNFELILQRISPLVHAICESFKWEPVKKIGNFIQWPLSPSRPELWDCAVNMLTARQDVNSAHPIIQTLLREFFTLPTMRVARWKITWFLTILTYLCPHQSLLVLQTSPKSNDIFWYILNSIRNIFRRDFGFTVSIDCSCPSKYGNSDTGWIFSAISRQKSTVEIRNFVGWYRTMSAQTLFVTCWSVWVTWLRNQARLVMYICQACHVIGQNLQKICKIT